MVLTGRDASSSPRLVSEHLIRRSRHIVQDRPSLSVCWADIPELSVRTGQALSSGLAAVLATVAALAVLVPTVRFSGRTYPQLARIVRALCAVAGRCC